jgi:hypothetical protein
MPIAAPLPADDELAFEVGEFYDNPLAYVCRIFPWGEGELSHATGPDKWQTQCLLEIGEEIKARKFDGHTPVAPIRFIRASGHDIGKTTMAAWIVNWIKDTRPDSQGTVTANTFQQLETKTWAAIQRWAKLAGTASWWDITASAIRFKGRHESWFVTPQTCSEENSESFAGQHAKFSTSYYIFDEASAIPDKVWQVAEGGLTDGEPMMFAFGNPTRNTGRFYESCFGNGRHRWNFGSIDSRDSGISNKQTIREWLEDYGEDSDFFRVRVKGLPPRQDENQFIGKDVVNGAQMRKASPLDDEPLIAGFDVSGGGAAWNIIRFRRGLDACPGASVPDPVRIPGARADRPALIARCAQILRDDRTRYRVAMMFVDSAFGSPIVERLRTLGFDNVVEVNFGGRSPDDHQENMRAYMWNQCKEWLGKGSIDPKDTKLEIDLTSPGFHFNKSNKLVLESKEDMARRGVPSPDDADALCLTFAAPVSIQQDYGYDESAGIRRANPYRSVR